MYCGTIRTLTSGGDDDEQYHVSSFSPGGRMKNAHLLSRLPSSLSPDALTTDFFPQRVSRVSVSPASRLRVTAKLSEYASDFRMNEVAADGK